MEKEEWYSSAGAGFVLLEDISTVKRPLKNRVIY